MRPPEGNHGGVIRPETSDDIEGIRAVVTAAFGRPDEAGLVDALRADGDAPISLVWDAGTILGHVLLSPMAASFRALGVAPLSVMPDQQRRGIGGRLVRKALEAAAGDGWQAVFVLGDPAYYGRFGFDAGRAAGFTSPYAGPYLQMAVLHGPVPLDGRIDYAPAFGRLP